MNNVFIYKISSYKIELNIIAFWYDLSFHIIWAQSYSKHWSYIKWLNKINNK
jgi:hypothetical protein